MAKEEYWCHNPEVLLHRRRLVRYLSIVIGATPNGRWTTVGTGSLHFFWVKFVVEKALEACPRWCYAKPESNPRAIFFPAHKTAFAHSRLVELDHVCRCTRNTPCIPFLRSAALCPAGRPILTLFLASSRLPSPPSVALSLSGQSEAERSSYSHPRRWLEASCSKELDEKPRVVVRRWRGWASRTHSPAR